MLLTARRRPLVAVVFRVPLFVEALTAAFDGLADLQQIRARDGALSGLLQALRPDAVVVEDSQFPELRVSAPILYVDLEAPTVRRLVDGEWHNLDLELSGEDIRNAVFDAILCESVY